MGAARTSYLGPLWYLGLHPVWYPAIALDDSIVLLIGPAGDDGMGAFGDLVGGGAGRMLTQGIRKLFRPIHFEGLSAVPPPVAAASAVERQSRLPHAGLAYVFPMRGLTELRMPWWGYLTFRWGDAKVRIDPALGRARINDHFREHGHPLA